ncbi:MAG: NAD(P)-binding protein, partial [Hypericibacter sp.]
MAGAGQVYDVAIVGAGSAGLAAAKTARSLGLDVVVLEASHRIGGRGYT